MLLSMDNVKRNFLLIAIFALGLTCSAKNCSVDLKLKNGKIFRTLLPNDYNSTEVNYKGGEVCDWNVFAAGNNPIKINCNINVTKYKGNEDCELDFIMIENERICGNRTYQLTSKKRNLTIALRTSNQRNVHAVGGSFFCSVKEGPSKIMRIVGGEKASAREYPMMAMIYNIRRRLPFCGGTIITEKHILTAAHCLTDVASQDLAVLVGADNLDDSYQRVQSELVGVEGYIRHPQYNNYHNDIAIIVVQTIQGIGNSFYIDTAIVDNQRNFVDSGYVTVIGWGLTSAGGSPSRTLQKARLNILDFSTCRQLLSQDNLLPSQLCVIAYNRGPCQKDSGGPILWTNSYGQTILIGIISVGRSCGKYIPAVATRVSYYEEWITKVLERTGYGSYSVNWAYD